MPRVTYHWVSIVNCWKNAKMKGSRQTFIGPEWFTKREKMKNRSEIALLDVCLKYNTLVLVYIMSSRGFWKVYFHLPKGNLRIQNPICRKMNFEFAVFHKSHPIYILLKKCLVVSLAFWKNIFKLKVSTPTNETRCNHVVLHGNRKYLEHLH